MEITFECEVITPMFIYGSDGEKPELRPPAIKSMIRIWYRIIYHDLLSMKSTESKEIQNMLNEESKVFGGKAKEYNSANRKIEEKNYKGKFNIHVIETKIETITPDKYPNNLGQGIKYLLYSVLAQTKKTYIDVGSTFSIKIRSNNEEILQKVSESFIYLSIFGALGARSRRGGGNFIIKNIKCNGVHKDKIIKNQYNLSFNTKDSLKTGLNTFKLEKFLDQKDQNYNIYIFDDKNNNSNIPFKSWYNALNFLGEKFREFRYPNNKPNENTSDVYNTPKFGFPISHKPISSRDKKTTFIAKKIVNDKTEILTRRGSTLIFKVIKTDDNKYFSVLLWLKGEFLPDGFKIYEKNEKRDNPQDRDIINDFIKTLT